MPEGVDAVSRPYRLFIAVDLPRETRAACRELIAAVSGSRSVGTAAGRLRWTRPANLHLTLRFLGDMERTRIASIDAAIRSAVTATLPFTVTLGGVGVFPGSGTPRALWLGISRGREELAAIVGALDAELASIGIAAATAPYRPHLTIARAGRGENAAARAAATALRAATSDWQATFGVDRIRLYRSHLGDGPPRYETLASIPLPS
jgi:2'-5' RNA ligase